MPDLLKTIFLILVAIILPPLAVFLKKGFGMDLLLNVIFCLLFLLPGIIHAIWIVINN